MSLGEAAAEGDCWCDSFEVADVESWPSGIWVTDSNTEKRRKGEPKIGRHKPSRGKEPLDLRMSSLRMT